MASENDTQVANRLKAAETLEHLDALEANPHFAWFMATLAKKRDDERALALDKMKSTAERDQACWRHDLAEEFCDLPRRLRLMHKTQASSG